MCLSSMAFILLGLVINQDGSEPPYQMPVSCLTKLLRFVFSFFMLIWCLTRPLFINGDRPVAVVSLTNHHLCFTQQVQRISLWCSTQQSNPQDTTRPQGKTTRPSYGANFHFSPPADFTATQVVSNSIPIPFCSYVCSLVLLSRTTLFVPKTNIGKKPSSKRANRNVWVPSLKMFLKWSPLNFFFLFFFFSKIGIPQRSSRHSCTHRSTGWRQHWQQTRLLPSVFRWDHLAPETLTIKCAAMRSI